MPLKLSSDLFSLFPGHPAHIATVQGDNPLDAWVPSAHRDERIRKRRSQYLCRLDAAGHASIFFVLFFIVMVATIFGRPMHVSVDLPKTDHPSWLPGALREDAMHLAVTRDGKLYLGRMQLTPDHLPGEIRKALRTGAENRIYVSADARARYRQVKTALDAIRLAGVERVSFITWTWPSAPVVPR